METGRAAECRGARTHKLFFRGQIALDICLALIHRHADAAVIVHGHGAAHRRPVVQDLLRRERDAAPIGTDGVCRQLKAGAHRTLGQLIREVGIGIVGAGPLGIGNGLTGDIVLDGGRGAEEGAVLDCGEAALYLAAHRVIDGVYTVQLGFPDRQRGAVHQLHRAAGIQLLTVHGRLGAIHGALLQLQVTVQHPDGGGRLAQERLQKLRIIRVGHTVRDNSGIAQRDMGAVVDIKGGAAGDGGNGGAAHIDDDVLFNGNGLCHVTALIAQTNFRVRLIYLLLQDVRRNGKIEVLIDIGEGGTVSPNGGNMGLGVVGIDRCDFALRGNSGILRIQAHILDGIIPANVVGINTLIVGGIDRTCGRHLQAAALREHLGVCRNADSRKGAHDGVLDCLAVAFFRTFSIDCQIIVEREIAGIGIDKVDRVPIGQSIRGKRRAKIIRHQVNADGNIAVRTLIGLPIRDRNINARAHS